MNSLGWIWGLLAAVSVMGCVSVVEGQGPEAPSVGTPSVPIVTLEAGPAGTDADKAQVEELLLARRTGAGAPYQIGDFSVVMSSSNWTPWPRYRAMPSRALIQRMGSRDSRDRQPVYGVIVDGHLYEKASGARVLMRLKASENPVLAAAIWLSLTTSSERPVWLPEPCDAPLWEGETLHFCSEGPSGDLKRYEVLLTPAQTRRRVQNPGVTIQPIEAVGSPD